ncbi:MAG: amino acid ABC transporter substrate-binding protein [Proteobacteria bacterium]|nr:amino acid ABC transporter substrate-binding protein [Pseudomonadota bacterium]
MFKKLLLGMAAIAVAAGTTPAFAQNSPTLAKIKAAGTISMGHREASVPFSYMDKDGKPIGYSIDICMLFINEVKKELNIPDLKIKYVPVTSQTRIPLLANGTIDIECGSTTNNLTRAKQIDYLPVTFITGTKILLKKDSSIKGIEDMNGKTVGLSLGTTNEKAFKAAAAELKIDVKYVMVKDHPQGMLNLESGRTDAYSTDDVLLYGLASTSKDPASWKVVGKFLSYDPYGIMVPRNDSEFRLIGTRTIADLMRSGELEKIYDKWFNPGPTNINMPISSDLKKAFEIQALPH